MNTNSNCVVLLCINRFGVLKTLFPCSTLCYYLQWAFVLVALCSLMLFLFFPLNVEFDRFIIMAILLFIIITNSMLLWLSFGPPYRFLSLPLLHIYDSVRAHRFDHKNDSKRMSVENIEWMKKKTYSELHQFVTIIIYTFHSCICISLLNHSRIVKLSHGFQNDFY